MEADMVRIEKIKDLEVFVLETLETSYVFTIDECGNPIHLYYGARLGLCGDEVSLQMVENTVLAISQKCINQNGCSIVADEKLPNISLDDVCLEMSSRGKGGMGEPFVELVHGDGSRTSDFRYTGCRIEDEKAVPDLLPGAYGDVKSLVIEMQDKNSEVMLELVYSVFENCNCITRFSRLINNGCEPLRINRLMSVQLDVDIPNIKISSFHGDWAREMGKTDTLLQHGKFVSDSATGFSSNKANPFIMFGETNVNEESGECFASNLIYSGNHRECVEAYGHGKMRFITGINPDTFEWMLETNEKFCSPEAVITYSNLGYRGISKNMHMFVREHIVRGKWQKKVRPVLINSWEAMYFDINEKKLLHLAKEAVDLGIELFVLDDGWFGKRNSDKTSLGDWYDNKEKLPNGLGGLSDKIKALGMKFGIWVEPEMVSEDSELYKKHPEWAVKIPGRAHSLGRNQMILDLTNNEVQDYIIESMSDVFTRGKVSYVKWDMNRHMSDMYSQSLPNEREGEFNHRYILGLYRVLNDITTKFPDILFEACASGGNRFDLGMLCFMPQVWASDNTDALSRAYIQNGYSYGYPQSVIGAHVSGCPNHQTLRVTPLESRFAIACAGILGYECNICDMGKNELSEIKSQVALYKKWRNVLQFGKLYRLNDENFPKSEYDTDIVKWEILSDDRSKAVGITMQGLVTPNFSHHSFKAVELKEDVQYHFYNRTLKYDIHRMGDLVNTMAPIHIKQDSLIHNVVSKFVRLDGEVEDYTIMGQVLNKAGVRLSQTYAGTGFGTNTAIYQDFDARVYMVEEVRSDNYDLHGNI
jgi:alpha-galactosidase